MQQYSCMAPILLCGQRAVQGRESLTVGLPWVAVLICLVPDAPFAVEEADAASSNPLPMAHQLIVGLLFWTGLLLSLARDAQVAAQHAESASFAVALANKLVICHATILQAAEYNRALAIKSLPCLQRQGHCQMHPLMTYIHLCAP